MQRLIAEMAELARNASTEPTDTGVPGLVMIKGDVPDRQLAALYNPMIGLVVQGEKILSVGGSEIHAVAPSYFLVPMHLPVRAKASPSWDGRPYLSLGLALNHDAIQSLLRDIPRDVQLPASRTLNANEANEEFIKPWIRLLRLMKAKNDVPALAPVYEREI